ncbi:proton-translocating NADH-quinone oxidoreductase, chain M [Hydrogenobacter thermophilus TK-6]|uniref:NADH dehydrogenase chain M n=1 Tax=Hydrogenobacter thermophilus (strain DSM 6534 / IAM 12695 / TK-6) TaxID=608538 RepID=D3DGC3_HYDTT|nr:NuoM family protein [Hydrogenobacter thermophilus]ADO44811.1 proton-translocating NADH-quinone oxidoreductase, chain M [Hydrogenobacter thermophilus TK-6]BAI68875.1 NADH dehydrogenase chain M [Hydrogenobacter thermophilus TK-6]
MERLEATFPLLPLSMMVPVFGSLLILLLPERFSKGISLFSAGISFLIALSSLLFFDFSKAQAVQFYQYYPLIPELKVGLALGLDGLSMLMYLLTTLVSFVAILWSVRDRQINHRLREYYLWFLLSEAFLIGVFSSWDLMVFYVFYELTLVPMLFVIGIWGYKLRLYSAYKFFIYIFVSSLFLLLGIVSLAVEHYKLFGKFSFSYFDLLNNHYSLEYGLFLFLLFFIAFAVKTPIVPFHTWLPDAHGEAPTAGSVVLAAILLKMGTYALLRFNIGLFPEVAVFLMPVLVLWGIFSIAVASWYTISQSNVKRFVAYSSVSHMGFVVTGMFLLNMEGLRASIMEMFAHGLTSASLFMIAGFIYNRLHSFNMDSLKGSAKYMPLFAIITVLTAFSSMGLPGGSSFWGKFLTILSAREYTTLLAFLVLVGAFFSAVYILYLMKVLFLDSKEESKLVHFTDVRGFKLSAFLLLVFPMFMVGLAPYLFFNIFDKSAKELLLLVMRKLVGG